jgi:hypothetical protein
VCDEGGAGAPTAGDEGSAVAARLSAESGSVLVVSREMSDDSCESGEKVRGWAPRRCRSNLGFIFFLRAFFGPAPFGLLPEAFVLTRRSVMQKRAKVAWREGAVYS